MKSTVYWINKLLCRLISRNIIQMRVKFSFFYIVLNCKLKRWNIRRSYLLYNVLLPIEERKIGINSHQHHHMVGRNYFELLIWRWSFHIKIQLCKWDPDQEKWNEPHSNHIKAFVLWFLKYSQKVAESNSHILSWFAKNRSSPVEQ